MIDRALTTPIRAAGHATGTEQDKRPEVSDNEPNTEQDKPSEVSDNEPNTGKPTPAQESLLDQRNSIDSDPSSGGDKA